MASSRARTSASRCRCVWEATIVRGSNRRRRPMPPDGSSFRAWRAGVALLGTLALAGCTSLMSNQRPPTPPPQVNPATTSSAVLNEYLMLLQRLVQGRPSEQAEIVAAAQRDYDTAPTPSHMLKLALILGTPGHPA